MIGRENIVPLAIPEQRRSKEVSPTGYDIQPMGIADVSGIDDLEQLWAPWLRKSRKDFEYIATHFGEMQRVAHPLNAPNRVAGHVTVVRTNWGGPEHDDFKTWDEVTAGPGGSVRNSDFSQTFRPDGNTLFLAAATVTVDRLMRVPGQRLAPLLVESVVEMADADPSIEFVISSFRPSDYYEYQMEHGPIDFDEYRQLKRPDGKLYDKWLRGVTELGMEQIRTIKDSMKVGVTREEFEDYRANYKPELWKPITEDEKTWLCGETGKFYIVGDPANPDPNAVYAEYREDNVLGMIPLTQPSESLAQAA